jgi:outer membrane immunogenic protein
VFVTGGAAISDVELKGVFSDTYSVVAQRIPLQAGHTSDMKFGFVWGGGIDLPLGGSTTLRVEYLHHDLGSIEYALPLKYTTGLTANNEVLSGKADLETNVVRVGLSWNL